MEESLNVALSSFVFSQIWLNFFLDDNNLCYKGKKFQKCFKEALSLSSSLVNFCTMAIKYFGKKKWKINFLWFFFQFPKFWKFLEPQNRGKEKKTLVQRLWIQVWIWMSFKAWFQGGFSGSKCQKGQLYTDFSACLYLTFKLQTFS